MKHNKFEQIKDRLDRAKCEILEALIIANKTAKCCGSNLDFVLSEIDKSLEITQDHIDKGINETELIKGES